jgi:DNA primase
MLRDHKVPYSTPETSNNVGSGWVGVCCPFCDDVSDHMGIDLERGSFKCWRCGAKPAPKALSALLRVPEQDARKILLRYGWRGKNRKSLPRNVNRKVQSRSIKFPSGTTALGKRERKYLAKRGFDPDEMEEAWGVRATGPTSRLDGIDYKHRIIIPIFWDGQMVSWQSRDVTGKAGVRYKACPQEREKIHHQDILYGQPEVEWGSVGLAVEGVTDAWRLGPMAFATFGVEFTSAQVQAIARQFDRVVMLFDPEEIAQNQAKKLADWLHSCWVRVEWVELPCDPGDLDQQEADRIIAPFAES